jgi:hypothetical protein
MAGEGAEEKEDHMKLARPKMQALAIHKKFVTV